MVSEPSLPHKGQRGAETCSQDVFLMSCVLLFLTLEETERARVAHASDREPEASDS